MTIRLDLDTPKDHHPFLGLDLPHELTMEMTGSQDDYIVGANGIPRNV